MIEDYNIGSDYIFVRLLGEHIVSNMTQLIDRDRCIYENHLTYSLGGEYQLQIIVQRITYNHITELSFSGDSTILVLAQLTLPARLTSTAKQSALPKCHQLTIDKDSVSVPRWT